MSEISNSKLEAYVYIAMNGVFLLIYTITAILVYKRFRFYMDKLAKLNILIFILVFIGNHC